MAKFGVLQKGKRLFFNFLAFDILMLLDWHLYMEWNWN